MVIATPIQKGPVMMIVESLPLLIMATALWWLRPKQGMRNLAEVV